MMYFVEMDKANRTTEWIIAAEWVETDHVKGLLSMHAAFSADKVGLFLGDVVGHLCHSIKIILSVIIILTLVIDIIAGTF